LLLLVACPGPRGMIGAGAAESSLSVEKTLQFPVLSKLPKIR
jgi:hypothetical protein